MATRLFSFFFLILSLNIHSQATKELIDSLNTINDHQKKVELCRKIAVKLQKLDWDRAIKYIELAESEARKTENSELTLAYVYVTAGKIYASKEVFDVSGKNGQIDHAFSA